MSFISKTLTIALCVTGAASSAIAGPQTNLVQNGTFSQSSNPTDYNYEFSSTYGDAGAVTGWTGNSGFNLYFWAGTQDSPSGCAHTRFGDCQNYFWPSMTALSPTSNFVALDGDTTPGANLQGGISQTIGGLAAGQSYVLSFDWGASQLQNRSGPTTEQLQVSLGSQVFKTATLSNTSGGFTGWIPTTFTFTATGASEVLSFLSIGSPQGEPPVAVLDDVTLAVAVPEPGSLALLAAGAVFIVSRGRKKALLF